MDSIVSVSGLRKTYDSGHQALKSVDLEIKRGEIFALLGPNGAGKTTLIGIICGLVRASGGTVIADGFDIAKDYRQARQRIGLVPQELALNIFDKVYDTVWFSRGLYGKPPDDGKVEQVLRSLSLWDKKDSKIVALSGGMKRRLLIAKALAHDPTILFLDEPSAGVDVELRREMWDMVRKMRDDGVTIILTTHYIEEAEEMADRIGVIDKGELILVEEKNALMRKLGKTNVVIALKQAMSAIPGSLASWPLQLSGDGLSLSLSLTGETEARENMTSGLIKKLVGEGIDFRSIDTNRSSLEDIFVDLVGQR